MLARTRRLHTTRTAAAGGFTPAGEGAGHPHHLLIAGGITITQMQMMGMTGMTRVLMG